MGKEYDVRTATPFNNKFDEDKHLIYLTDCNQAM